jgi:hypothetical protein
VAEEQRLEGASQFAPMSRPMTKGEVDAFEKKYGYKPVERMSFLLQRRWL